MRYILNNFFFASIHNSFSNHLFSLISDANFNVFPSIVKTIGLLILEIFLS